MAITPTPTPTPTLILIHTHPHLTLQQVEPTVHPPALEGLTGRAAAVLQRCMHGRAPRTCVSLQKRACRRAWPPGEPDGSTCEGSTLQRHISAGRLIRNWEKFTVGCTPGLQVGQRAVRTQQLENYCVIRPRRSQLIDCSHQLTKTFMTETSRIFLYCA